MSRSSLWRAAGPLAIVAGVLVVLTRLPTVLFLLTGSQDMTSFVLGPLHAVNGVASIAAFALLTVALAAIYRRQEDEARPLGLVGFALAVVGTVFMAGDWWYEAFAVPRIADVAPELIPTFVGGRLLMGGIASFVLFGIGWAVFGIASLRARVFPSPIAVAILIGGLLSGVPIGVAYLTGQVILGVAVAWLGVRLMNESSAVS
jgi:hypothetical protein